MGATLATRYVVNQIVDSVFSLVLMAFSCLQLVNQVAVERRGMELLAMTGKSGADS